MVIFNMFKNIFIKNHKKSRKRVKWEKPCDIKTSQSRYRRLNKVKRDIFRTISIWEK